MYTRDQIINWCLKHKDDNFMAIYKKNYIDAIFVGEWIANNMNYSYDDPNIYCAFTKFFIKRTDTFEITCSNDFFKSKTFRKGSIHACKGPTAINCSNCLNCQYCIDCIECSDCFGCERCEHCCNYFFCTDCKEPSEDYLIKRFCY